MEHEEIFTLMMDALDDELDETDQRDMRTHLESCPSCSQEWEAIQTIHQLFLQTPALSPAAGFAERTLNRLPNPAYRIWLSSVVYGLLLISGLLPIITVIWLSVQFGPALEQPAFVDGLIRAGGQVVGLAGTVLDALRQGAVNLIDLIGQQPAIIGIILVMVGAILLWGGIYSQLTNPRRVNNV